MTRAVAVALAALIAAHILLAVLYATQTPYRARGVVLINPSVEKDIGAPDERQHANYIGQLLGGEGFPVFDPKDPNLYENYQAHQPPLYYVVATGWHRALETLGVARPTEADGRRLPDGVPTRVLNALIGALTVAGVFALGWWGYRKPGIALGAAAIAALMPMNLALSGAISNDPLLFCLCTWVLAIAARNVRDGWSWKGAVWVGVLAGLAMLTKTTAVALLPVLLLVAVLPQTRRPSWAMAAAVGVMVLALAGPWWMRNQRLYGDPLAMGAFNQAFTGSAQRTTLVDQVIPQTNPGENPNTAYWVDWVGFWTARSFVGVFGYMDIWLTPDGSRSSRFADNTVYWLMIALFAVGIAGWAATWRGSEPVAPMGVRVANLAFFLIVLLLFLRFNVQYFQAQARYLYPAIGPIAVGLSLGFGRLAKREFLPAVGAAVLLLALNVVALKNLAPTFAKRIAQAERMEAE